MIIQNKPFRILSGIFVVLALTVFSCNETPVAVQTKAPVSCPDQLEWLSTKYGQDTLAYPFMIPNQGTQRLDPDEEAVLRLVFSCRYFEVGSPSCMEIREPSKPVLMSSMARRNSSTMEELMGDFYSTNIQIQEDMEGGFLIDSVTEIKIQNAFENYLRDSQNPRRDWSQYQLPHDRVLFVNDSSNELMEAMNQYKLEVIDYFKSNGYPDCNSTPLGWVHMNHSYYYGDVLYHFSPVYFNDDRTIAIIRHDASTPNFYWTIRIFEKRENEWQYLTLSSLGGAMVD